MILLEWISWKDFIDKETGIEKVCWKWPTKSEIEEHPAAYSRLKSRSGIM